MLYGTTKEFLLHFGLKDLAELPKIEEFAEVLGEEVDVAGLKKAIEAPRPVEIPLSEGEADPAQAELPLEMGEEAEEGDGPAEDET
jgi:segregation and condensation protein B